MAQCWTSDWRPRGREFDPRPRRGCVTTLGKLFTPTCLDADSLRYCYGTVGKSGYLFYRTHSLTHSLTDRRADRDGATPTTATTTPGPRRRDPRRQQEASRADGFAATGRDGGGRRRRTGSQAATCGPRRSAVAGCVECRAAAGETSVPSSCDTAARPWDRPASSGFRAPAARLMTACPVAVRPRSSPRGTRRCRARGEVQSSRYRVAWW